MLQSLAPNGTRTRIKYLVGLVRITGIKQPALSRPAAIESDAVG
ncbi:MAG TPA: hypothetical protein VFH01_12850 [Pyrinomonadaceae bacterium]|nr:hypothetical protein [Pyrinomonadaceae bacterium]